MTRNRPDRASFVVLAKDTSAAKTRLSPDREAAARVALDLAKHTIETVLAARSALEVFVVTSDGDIATHALSAGASIVSEVRPVGINAAAAMGRRRAMATHPTSAVAIIVADLPELTVADVESVVAEHADVGRPIFVPDHLDAGTTCLIHGVRRPGLGFGPDSARIHRQLGYVAAQRPLRGMRFDLDTPRDLSLIGRRLDAMATVVQA